MFFDEHIAKFFWHCTLVIGGVRMALAGEDYEQARELFTECSGKLNQKQVLTEEVRGWPLVIVMSLWAGSPLIFFGKKFSDPDEGKP